MSTTRMKKYNRTKVACEAVMVYLNGSSTAFRCACGCNVFGRWGSVYQCNACPREYEGR